jgi:hypothetical protein
VEVPRDAEGRPRFSISQFRTYGAAELALDEGEEPKGCPRLYQIKYQDKGLPPQPRSPHLEFGTVLHRALELMETDDIGPEDALREAWSPVLNEDDWARAKQTLGGYLARGGPMTKFGTLFVELDLSTQLYVDDEFGPVMFRTILDYVGLDGEDSTLVHAVDYKSNAAPPAREVVRRDAQLKAQHWQLKENWDRLIGSGSPRIVMHLDALRYRDVDVRFTPTEIEDWHDWAVAVARKILRDKDGAARLNSGCTYCPARFDCPLWTELPHQGRTIAQRTRGQSVEEMWTRRTELAGVSRLLTDEIKQLDKDLDGLREANGGTLRVGDQIWSSDTGWGLDVDWPRLHGVVGPRVWEAVSTSRAALERLFATLPGGSSSAEACVRRIPQGTKVKKQKDGGQGGSR